jgi:hypothetical protein
MRNSRFAFMEGNWATHEAYAPLETQLSDRKPSLTVGLRPLKTRLTLWLSNASGERRLERLLGRTDVEEPY